METSSRIGCYTLGVSIGVLSIIILATIAPVNGHGRMIEPPSRASAWRYGFSTPPNYNDHELFCGGFSRQWQKNNGKCGECGDAWDSPLPRPHEYGGKYGLGVVTRKYNPGSEFIIRIELTASHMGYFEFRVCPDPAGKQDCLDKYLLDIVGGTPSKPAESDSKTRFYPRDGSRIYEIRAKLPEGLECGNCLIQWIYVAGNNWGNCDDGTGAVGCGPQEQFRACSDISIGEGAPSPPLRPMRPATQPTKASIITKVPVTNPDESVSEVDDLEPPQRHVGLLIALLTLLFVMCCMIIIYLYHYHGKRIKQLIRWQHSKSSAAAQNGSASSPVSNYSMNLSLAPVPPPRSKRPSSIMPDIEANEPNVLTGKLKSFSPMH